MNIVCERCEARVPVEDVDLHSRLAKCRSCHAVFDFSAQVARQQGDAGGIMPARPLVPRPKGITVVEDGGAVELAGDYRSATRRRGRLVLRRGWFLPQHIFMVFFCIAWDSFLVFWYSSALRAPGSAVLVTILFPLIHVAVGAGLTYVTVAHLFNRTWITLTPDALTVRHSPLPWPGNRTLAVSEIAQLYCEESVRQRKGGATSYFTLSAVLRDGQKLELVKSLPAADQALYLEQQLEARIGIEDGRVGGDYRG